LPNPEKAMGRRPEQALIMSANALLDGAVVYYAPSGAWSPHLADALVAGSEKEAEMLASAREAALAAGSVVDPELLPVGIDPAGNFIPTHYREKIRALGPTIRRDLGPQAAGENAHVSL
jgi:hypothetical protein